ncbi:MAG: hypothetical protein WCO30_00630 [bacterium]
MLALQTRSQIIPKEIRLPNGKLVLGIFLVSEENGHLKARLVSIKPLEQSDSFRSTEKNLALPAYFEAQTIVPKKSVCSEYCFKTFKDFSFLTEQLTRAPSRI